MVLMKLIYKLIKYDFKIISPVTNEINLPNDQNCVGFWLAQNVMLLYNKRISHVAMDKQSKFHNKMTSRYNF